MPFLLLYYWCVQPNAKQCTPEVFWRLSKHYSLLFAQATNSFPALSSQWRHLRGNFRLWHTMKFKLNLRSWEILVLIISTLWIYWVEKWKMITLQTWQVIALNHLEDWYLRQTVTQTTKASHLYRQTKMGQTEKPETERRHGPNRETRDGEREETVNVL